MLTPEQVEDNSTAHPASKWRECPVCGEAHATPGWSAWVGEWSIAGCCSEGCKDAAAEEYVTRHSEDQSVNKPQDEPMPERKIFTKEEAGLLAWCKVRLVDDRTVRLLSHYADCIWDVMYIGDDGECYYANVDSRSWPSPNDIVEVMEWPEEAVDKPAIDETKVRETFIRLVYEAAMQVDCEKIQRMMDAVDWRWHGEVPSVDQVRDNLMEFCAKLIRDTKEIRSMAGPWSGGWYFIVDRGTDEDGPWVRVYLGWGEFAGNFEGETIA